MMSAERVYAEYCPKVRAYVRGKVKDHHTEEDLVSAVFLKIVQKLDRFDPARASLSTWVYAITRNTVTDHFRARRPMASWEDYMADETPSPNLDDDALADALLSLKEKERDLVVLHYYHGHTLKTVAETMGMSYINAKVVHKKALTGLQHFYATHKDWKIFALLYTFCHC